MRDLLVICLLKSESVHKRTTRGAALRADQRLRGEPLECLAHSRAGHVELVGQLGFGRQSFDRRSVARYDCIADRLRDLGREVCGAVGINFHLSYILMSDI